MPTIIGIGSNEIDGRWTDNVNTIPDLIKPLLFLTFFSVLAVFIQVDLHIVLQGLRLHIPGISGLLWIPLIVAAKVRWPRGISGTYMAFASSIAISLMGYRIDFGIADCLGGLFLKYGVPGIILDGLWPFAEKFLSCSSIYLVSVIGISALAHTGKALFMLLSCCLFNKILPCGLVMLVSLHFIFGAMGGAIAVGLSPKLAFLKQGDN